MLPSPCVLWITIHSYWNEANLSSFQDNANKYQPRFACFFHNFSLFTPLSALRAFLSFLRVEWKVSFFLSIKAEEKPGPGLIHVAHTAGMLCIDNWLSKQHGHRWILMVLPKCHLTDVTAAPILKGLVSKASFPSTLLSHCVWERQHCLSGVLFQRDRSCIRNLICTGQCTHFQKCIEHFQSWAYITLLFKWKSKAWE